MSAFTALQRQGIPSRLLYFAKENHWVLNRGNSVKWHYEVLRWMDEWVGEETKVEMDGEALDLGERLVFQDRVDF